MTPDLLDLLSQPMSKTNKNALAKAARHDPETLASLMHHFFEGDYRAVQNAAWAVSYVAELSPHMLYPYLHKMVHYLQQSEADAVKRNILRVLQFVEIPETLWGEVADRAFELLGRANEAVAIKAFAMTVLLKIVQEVPELKQELQVLVEDMLPFGSPAITSRGKRVLKALKKLPDV